jgi:FKBP-type peptidyl-prolyl cis-trans isomerase (trigger factor)
MKKDCSTFIDRILREYEFSNLSISDEELLKHIENCECCKSEFDMIKKTIELYKANSLRLNESQRNILIKELIAIFEEIKTK